MADAILLDADAGDYPRATVTAAFTTVILVINTGQTEYRVNMSQDAANDLGNLLKYVAGTGPVLPDYAAVWPVIDEAHTALRMVDASDTTVPQTAATLDAVGAAVVEVEALARKAYHELPEQRRVRGE